MVLSCWFKGGNEDNDSMAVRWSESCFSTVLRPIGREPSSDPCLLTSAPSAATIRCSVRDCVWWTVPSGCDRPAAVSLQPLQAPDLADRRPAEVRFQRLRGRVAAIRASELDAGRWKRCRLARWAMPSVGPLAARTGATWRVPADGTPTPIPAPSPRSGSASETPLRDRPAR